MNNEQFSADPVELTYKRYLKNNPEREAHVELIRRQATLARKMYDIRNKLRMKREDLAEYSSLPVDLIEDLEESDYDNDLDNATTSINRAFHNGFQEVILPAATTWCLRVDHPLRKKHMKAILAALIILWLPMGGFASEKTSKGEVRSPSGKLLYKTYTRGNVTETRDPGGKLITRSKTTNGKTEVRSPSGKLLYKVK